MPSFMEGSASIFECPHGIVFNFRHPKIGERVAAVAAMFLGAALGAAVIDYSISAVLWLANAISAVCGFVLFRSGPTPDKR